MSDDTQSMTGYAAPAALHLRLLNHAVLEQRTASAAVSRIQRRRLALLIRLVRAPRRRLPREDILAVLWPDSASDAGRRLLNEAVYVIRRELGASVIESIGDDLQLDPQLSCDVDEFLEHLRAQRVEAAVAAYRGPFLGTWFARQAPEFSRWADDERSALHLLFCDALQALAETEEAEGQFARAAARWMALVREDPLSAKHVYRAAAAFARAGETADALRTIDAHRHLAHDELGTRLSIDLVTLEADIRDGRLQRHLDEPEITPGARVRAVATTNAVVLTDAHSPPPEENGERTIASPPEFASRPRQRRRAVIGLLAFALAALAGTRREVQALIRGSAPEPQRLLIAPYRYVGPEDQAYLALSLTDELSARLAGLPDVQLLSSELLNRGDSTRTPLDVAAASDVDLLVQGSATVVAATDSGSRVQLIHTLVDARNGEVLWTWRHNGAAAEVLQIPPAVADSVARRLGIVLALSTASAQPVSDAVTRELILRGTAEQRRGREGFAAARGYFARAIARDSNDARALGKFAQLTAGMAYFLLERDSAVLASARQRLDRAQQLDPRSAELYVIRAGWHLQVDRNPRAALRSLDTALALRPDNALALTERANLRRRLNDWRGAANDFEQALTIDPLAYSTHLEFGNTLLLMHRYADATRHLLIARDLNPTAVDPPAWLAATAFRARGDTAEVIGLLSEARRRVDARRLRARLALSFPETIRAGVGTVFADLGTPTLADALGDTAAYLSLVAIAEQVPASLRRRAADSAQHVLERQIARSPEGYRTHRRLARLLALRGDSLKAYMHLQHALDAVQRQQDPISLAEVQLAIAEVEVLTGRVDSARSRVRSLLNVPSGLSPAVLAADPRWLPLRSGVTAKSDTNSVKR